MNVTYFESMYWISLETSDLTAFAGTDIDFDILKPYWQLFCKKKGCFCCFDTSNYSKKCVMKYFRDFWV